MNRVERRQAAAKAYQSNEAPASIAGRLGIAICTVYNDLKREGVSVGFRCAKGMDQAERRRAVAKAYQSDVAPGTIAARFGISVATVYNDLKHEGVSVGFRRLKVSSAQLRRLQSSAEWSRRRAEQERELMRRKASTESFQLEAQAARYGVPTERMREWRRLRREGWAPREVAAYMGLVPIKKGRP